MRCIPFRGASRSTRLLAVVAAFTSSGSIANADPLPDPSPAERLPVAQAQRPIVLPRLVASPQVAFQLDRRPNDGSYGELDVTGAFGETNRNQGPSLGAAYRFVRGTAELGLDLSGHVFTVPGVSGGSVTPSVLLRIHAAEILRLDLDPGVTFQIATLSPSGASANTVRVSVPLGARLNLTQAFDVGLTTGLTVYDVSDARNTTGIPLGFLLGFAMAGAQGPVVDIDPFFTFPYLVMPGRASPTNTGQYQVGLAVTGYFYL
jgi:hypothetical protein